MKRITLVFFVLVLFLTGSKNANAQYYFFDGDYYDSPLLFEAGVSINAMNCLTDMGGHKGIGKKFLKDLNLGKTNASGGIFFSASYKNAIAVRVEGTFGKISGNDDVLSGITDIAKERFNRNLNFNTSVKNASSLSELLYDDTNDEDQEEGEEGETNGEGDDKNHDRAGWTSRSRFSGCGRLV